MSHIDNNLFELAAFLRSQAAINNVLFIEDYIIPKKDYSLSVDAVLLKNQEILAVFAYFPYQQTIKTPYVLSEISSLVSSEYRYIVATNGKTLVLIDILNNNVQEVIPKDLILKIISPPSADELSVIKEQIASLLEEKTIEFIELNSEEVEGKRKFTRLSELIRRELILENLFFDADGHFFRLGNNITLKDNFENRLFNILVEEIAVGETIFRYATLETVFSTINYDSLRMNGLAGMNDSSEVDYVDKYLDNDYSFLSKPEDVEIINKRFISCFSTLGDTLNQWRLYGDDGRGACISFEITDPVEKLAGIKIKKINYGTKKNGRPFHMELELLKFLRDSVRIILGQSLRFRSINIWKHFFKSFEYTEEKEVRLLVVFNQNDDVKGGTDGFKKDWNVTGNYKIVAPYITVPLSTPSLPIKLTEITLGNKQQEKSINKVQLELMLKERGITHVATTISKIDNYR